MMVTRQVRGWVPRGPTGDMLRTEQLRRVNESSEQRPVTSSKGLGRSAHTAWARESRQGPVECSRKGLLVACTERGGATGHDPRDAGLLHEVPHRQPLTDRLRRCARRPVDRGPSPRWVPAAPPAARPASPRGRPALLPAAMCWSATSAPPSTHTAVTRGLLAGGRSGWFATSTTGRPRRFAALKTISFTSRRCRVGIDPDLQATLRRRDATILVAHRTPRLGSPAVSPRSSRSPQAYRWVSRAASYRLRPMPRAPFLSIALLFWVLLGVAPVPLAAQDSAAVAPAPDSLTKPDTVAAAAHDSVLRADSAAIPARAQALSTSGLKDSVDRKRPVGPGWRALAFVARAGLGTGQAGRASRQAFSSPLKACRSAWRSRQTASSTTCQGHRFRCRRVQVTGTRGLARDHGREPPDSRPAGIRVCPSVGFPR